MEFPEAISLADAAFSHFVQSAQADALSLFFQAITHLGNPGLWLVVGAIVYWTGRETQSFHFMNVLLFAAVASGMLKGFFARPRPDAETFKVLANDYYASYSFPSGHATVIAAYFSYFREKLRKSYKIIFAGLVMLVMLSRVYLGAHFLTDVVAGALLGAGIGWAAVFFREQAAERHFRLSKLQDELFFAATVLFALAALALVAEVTIIGLLLGFYAGFFLSKEVSLKQTHVSGQKMAEKQLLGLTGLAILAAPHFLEKGLADPKLVFAFMFLAGFWVSFLFPWLHEKLLNRK